jgi:uncharacterized protein (DUF2141 family)
VFLVVRLAKNAVPPVEHASMSPTREMSELDLVFNVVKYKKGALMIGLYDNEKAYTRGGDAVRGLKVDVTAHRVTVTVDGLKPGRYAVKAFHDLDCSGKLEFTVFGIPTKPVAFSNHAKVFFGPPSWSRACFEIVPGKNTTAIDIH